jgi:hypothetical protein
VHTAVGAALFVAITLALGQVLGMALGPRGASHPADPEADGSLGVEDAAYQARFHDGGFTVDTGPGVLDWSLASVERDGAAVAGAPRPWQREANVTTRALGRSVSERVTSRHGELQWDVVLGDRPAGEGPLTVRARLDGVDGVAGVDASGLRVALTGGTSVRVGQLRVVDARGRQLHRAVPTLEGGELRLRVPAAVLDEASYPLTLDPTISPERHVSPVPSDLLVDGTDVASDGTNRLAVFSSSGFDGQVEGLEATRLDANGNVLDPQNILLQPAVASVSDPAVAFVNGTYLVVFSAKPFGENFEKIWAVRVGVNGSHGGPFQITSGVAANQHRPAVSADGSGFLVAWSDERNGTATDLFGARVRTDGAVLDPSGFAIASAPQVQDMPSIAFEGTNHLVVWSDSRGSSNANDYDLYAAGVTPEGAVLNPGGSLLVDRPFTTAPDIAWSGSGFLVAWVDQSTSPAGIRAARLNTTGGVVDAGGFPLPTTDSSASPSVAFNGTSFQVVWSSLSNSYDIMGSRVATNGAVLDSPAKLVADTPGRQDHFPAIAAAGSSLQVVWNDSSTGLSNTGHALAARMATNGTVLDTPGRLLSQQTVDQLSPAVASGGGNQLVVWRDNRNFTNQDIFASRVTSSGSVLDPGGIALTSLPGADGFPAVAFGGGQFLVVWKNDPSGADNANIYAQRIGTNGVPAGAAFVVSGAVKDQSEPAVTFDGSNFLVAFTDLRNGGADIYAARVSPTGSVVDPSGFPVSTATGSQSGPEAAFDGSNALVVWSDGRNATNDIYGARVSPAGGVLEPAGIGIQTDGFTQFRPSVAFGGGSYLVAWDESGNIWGTRVTTAGGVVNPSGIALSLAGDQQDSPAVAFNGTFLVAWNDRRSGVTYDIYGTRVATDGTVQDPNGLALTTGPTDELSPALTNASSWGLVYHHALGDGSGIFHRGVK